MILADTSAWIEYLRGTGSDPHVRLRELLRAGRLATTDAVWMEVVAGARDNAGRARLDRLLGTCQMLRTIRTDFVVAADLHRACRRQGVTPRQLLDCLIAGVAIRCDVPLLHGDRDFDRIASVSALQVA